MAPNASQSCMLVFQRKTGFVMIEFFRIPPCENMATFAVGHAVLVELFKMHIGMAINTRRVNSGKLLCPSVFTLRKMATSARNSLVFILQAVIGLVVVESYLTPSGYRMAVFTFVVGQIFIGQHIFMEIIVALGTLLTPKGKVPSGIRFMTSKTGCCQMRTLQREFRPVMLFDGKA